MGTARRRGAAPCARALLCLAVGTFVAVAPARAQVSAPTLPSPGLPSQSILPQLDLPAPVRDLLQAPPPGPSDGAGGAGSQAAPTPRGANPPPNSAPRPPARGKATVPSTEGVGSPAGSPTKRRRPATRRPGAAGTSRNGSAARRPRAMIATTPAGARRNTDGAAARHAAKGRSLPGSVRRVIEVVPWQLWVATGVLAVVGLAMAGRAALATAREQRIRRHRAELLEDVGALQAAVLPPVPAAIAGVEVSVAYQPASGPAAGGDFHDMFELPGGRVGLLVGDVSGHGRRALVVTPLVHYTARAYLEAGLSPREALALTDRVLEDKLGDDFATVLAAVYDPATGRLQYSTAGHPVPLLSPPGPHVPIEILTPPPVGMGPRSGSRETTIAVAPGTSVCFFTDGIVEARADDGSHELLGREGLARILAQPESTACAEAVLGRVPAAADGQRDDMTACMLKVGDGPAQGHTVEELDLTRGAPADGRLREFLELCGLGSKAAQEVVEALPAHTRDQGATLTIVCDPCGAHAAFRPPQRAAAPELSNVL